MASFNKIENTVKLMGLRISFDIYPLCLGANYLKISHMISSFKNYSKFDSIRLKYEHPQIYGGKAYKSRVILKTIGNILSLSNLYVELSIDNPNGLSFMEIQQNLNNNVKNLHLSQLNFTSLKMTNLLRFI